MKISGQCPKCGCKEIICFSPHRKKIFSSSIVINSFKMARLEKYICKNCGFVEEYVLKEDIQEFDD